MAVSKGFCAYMKPKFFIGIENMLKVPKSLQVNQIKISIRNILKLVDKSENLIHVVRELCRTKDEESPTQ